MNKIIMIPVKEIYPHPDNPRKDLGDLSELAASIRESGVLQNLNDTGLRMLAERWNHEKLERRPFPSEKTEPHKTARYRLDISLKDNMIAFVGGNPGALACLNQLSGYASLRKVMISLDAVGIYEEKIYMLWNDCCGRDPIEMIKTLSLFDRGEFTYEEIHNNLDQTRASSFLKMYEERNGA